MHFINSLKKQEKTEHKPPNIHKAQDHQRLFFCIEVQVRMFMNVLNWTKCELARHSKPKKNPQSSWFAFLLLFEFLCRAIWVKWSQNKRHFFTPRLRMNGVLTGGKFDIWILGAHSWFHDLATKNASFANFVNHLAVFVKFRSLWHG